MSFIRTEKTYPDEDCGICLDPLTSNVWEHVEIHRFHGMCIKDWAKDNNTCPICREVVDMTTLLGKKVLSNPPVIPRVIYNGFLLLGASSVCIHTGLFLSLPEARQFRNALFYFEITCLAVVIVVKKFFIPLEQNR